MQPTQRGAGWPCIRCEPWSAASQALAKELLGTSRQDGWELVAYVLEGRAAGHQAAGRLAQALALRLLALQLLHAAVQEAKAGLAAAALAEMGTEGGHSGVEEMQSSTLSMASGPAGSAPGPGIVRRSAMGSAVGVPMTPLRAVALRAQIERLAARQRVVAGRAEKVGSALAERGEGELPEPWELAHQDALELARTAAVEETLGNHAASRDAYAQVLNSLTPPLLFMWLCSPAVHKYPPEDALCTC